MHTVLYCTLVHCCTDKAGAGPGSVTRAESGQSNFMSGKQYSHSLRQIQFVHVVCEYPAFRHSKLVGLCFFPLTNELPLSLCVCREKKSCQLIITSFALTRSHPQTLYLPQQFLISATLVPMTGVPNTCKECSTLHSSP